MNGVRSAPAFIHSDTHKDKYIYVVMEYLGGEDMSRLRDATRSSIGAIPVNIVCYLMMQMIQGTEDLHKKGFIHRDIKPANFVRRSKTSTEYCMLDFGISKQYREKNGDIRKKRSQAEFRGTSAYASPHAHNKEDLCPRDDLYSLWFVFLDLLCGQLPWTEAARERDKQRVTDTKKVHLEEPDKLADWAHCTFLSAHSTLVRSISVLLLSIVDCCIFVFIYVTDACIYEKPCIFIYCITHW
jgi:serine/threonine protein kinase